MTRHVIWSPNPGPQTFFLATEVDEGLYGGAVGGGKTDDLIVMPTRRAVNPLHTSIYFRRERDHLQESIDRARRLYGEIDPGGYWHETEGRYKWSTGASTYFGHAKQIKDIEKYKTFEFDLVLFDELTEFDEYQYRFMFSRNRTKDARLSPWMRSATNPGGVGMAWVDQRFLGLQNDGSQLFQPYQVYKHEVFVEGIGALQRTRQFIPSTVFDNPKLPDRERYIAGLADLPEADREAMLYGRWGKFKGQYFPKAPREVEPGIKLATGWYVIRCMDYGWTDPTAIYWLVVYPENGLVEIAHEVYAPGMTTDSIAQMITAAEQEIGILPSKIHASVISPDTKRGGTDGGQSIVSLLSEAGMWFAFANPDRIAGWAQMLRLIAADRLRVWQGRAPNFMRTLTKLPREDTNPQDVRRRGVEDHGPEAVRYGLMAYRGLGKEVPTEPEEPSTSRRDPYWDALKRHLDGHTERQSEYMPGLGYWS